MVKEKLLPEILEERLDIAVRNGSKRAARKMKVIFGGGGNRTVERQQAQKKLGELVAQKGQLEANIRSMVEKQLKAKKLGPEKIREAFVTNFMMGAHSGDIEVTKNDFGRKESGYEIVRPIGAGPITAKLVSARDGFVLAVRDGENLLNPVFLIAKPFSIAMDPHALLRHTLHQTLHKYMKAYAYIDTMYMPYSR